VGDQLDRYGDSHETICRTLAIISDVVIVTGCTQKYTPIVNAEIYLYLLF
jgi:hypothetical protein